MENGEMNGRAFWERQEQFAERWKVQKEQEIREKEREESSVNCSCSSY